MAMARHTIDLPKYGRIKPGRGGAPDIRFEVVPNV